jgi:hypothetical protein
MVALPTLRPYSECVGVQAAGALDIGEALAAIDMRFATAQQIEIGAIKNEYRRIHGGGYNMA